MKFAGCIGDLLVFLTSGYLSGCFSCYIVLYFIDKAASPTTLLREYTAAGFATVSSSFDGLFEKCTFYYDLELRRCFIILILLRVAGLALSSDFRSVLDLG